MGEQQPIISSSVCNEMAVGHSQELSQLENIKHYLAAKLDTVNPKVFLEFRQLHRIHELLRHYEDNINIKGLPLVKESAVDCTELLNSLTIDGGNTSYHALIKGLRDVKLDKPADVLEKGGGVKLDSQLYVMIFSLEHLFTSIMAFMEFKSRWAFVACAEFVISVIVAVNALDMKFTNQRTIFTNKMLCVLENPNLVLHKVRYKQECLLLCQGDSRCANVNWKAPSTCEMYFYYAGVFGKVKDCVYFGQGCPASVCENGGSCVESNNYYTCSCRVGFTGERCETETSTLILRNYIAGSNSYFFARSWAQFQHEFGIPTPNKFGSTASPYWIGLDRMHNVSQKNCPIRFDLLLGGSLLYAQYSSFSVGDCSTNYTLTIGGYSGNAGDGMTNQNGQQFETYDVTHSNWFKNPNCAGYFGGGFWYSACATGKITTSPEKYFYWNYLLKLSYYEARVLC